MIKCFMIEPNGEGAVSLRRYARASGSGWTCAEGHHDAMAPIGKCRYWRKPDPYDGRQGRWVYDHDAPEVAHDDPRWPASCACRYVFQEADVWQVFTDRIYVGPDGAEYSLRTPPPGALWWAEWLEDLEGDGWWKGPDGRILMAQTPGGQWCIDSRASNCTMPTDNEHRCWVRHGTPPD